MSNLNTKPVQHFSLWVSPTYRIGRGKLYTEGNVMMTWTEVHGHCHILLANLNEAMKVVPNITGLTFHEDPNVEKGADGCQTKNR